MVYTKPCPTKLSVSGTRTLRSEEYIHTALNRLIQGSAADMTKKAMVELHKEGITPHIQVHDELDISVSDNVDKIKEIMESSVNLEVPIKVDFEYGKKIGVQLNEEKLWHI